MACSGCQKRRENVQRIIAATRQRNLGEAQEQAQDFLKSSREDLSALRNKVNITIPSRWFKPLRMK